MHFLMRKDRIKMTSLILTVILVFQVAFGAIQPLVGSAAGVNQDNTVTFSLPVNQIDVRATGSFDNWEGQKAGQTVTRTVNGDRLQFDMVITGLTPNTTYEYKLILNGSWMGDPNQSITSDGDGKIQITYTPDFYVFGSFDQSWGNRNKLVLNGSGDTLSYTSAPLANGTYEYKFISVDAGNNGYPEIYFIDPTNPVTSNGNSKIKVGDETAPTILPDPLVSQPGGENKWYVAGSFQGWNNTSTPLVHLGAGFYEYSTVLDAGSYEFKIVKNGSWDGFSHNGGNFTMNLSETSKVNIYVNEVINEARINIAGVAGLPQYVPSLNEDKWPRLVGDIQSVFGEAVWSPTEAQQMFLDYYFNGTVYKLQREIPIGKYEFKVAMGPSWSESYGQGNGNAVLQTLDPTDVIFTLDYSASNKEVVHDYKPKDGNFDGLIKNAAISYDSRSMTYKKPFGAIRQGQQDVTLRIAAEKDDVQLAKVELTNADGNATAFAMSLVTSVDGKDYFEAVIPKAAFDKIGIWGYKFILIDGMTKVEYGDDGLRGGSGVVSAEGAIPFDLTVYDPNYHTPDWMKNAVVYQIFPDRFFDGNQDNNRAKLVDGYRGIRDESKPAGERLSEGSLPLQYFDNGVENDPAANQVWGDWNTIPENPDRSKPENKPYYPDSATDGVWTNEFYGGDLQGIQQKLDYLKSIGVTVIYLNPVAWAASNHKYDATDYKHLDPMFGEPVYNTPGDPTSGLDYDATRRASDQVFMNVAKAAKAVGIQLITDGVFNHVGDDSIYFDRYEKYPEIGAYEYWAKVWDKVNDNGLTQAEAEQQVRDFYTSQINPATGDNYVYPDDFGYTTTFTIKNQKVLDRDQKTSMYSYDAWWGYDSLPAFDAKNPQPGDSLAIEGTHEWNNVIYRDEVIGHDLTGMTNDEADQAMQSNASQRWEWMGASGWRLDVAPDVSSGTWQKFRDAVKSTAGRTDANGQTIADPIILGEEWGVATRYLLGDQFDSVMNYRFRAALQGFLTNGDAAAMNTALESIREDYPEEAWQVMLNLVGSHDTSRHITKLDYPQYEEEHLVVAGEASERAIKLQALTAIFQMGYPGAPTIYYGDEVGVTGTKDPDSRRSFPWERVLENNGSFSGVGRYQDLFNVYQKAGSVRADNEVFRTGDLKVAYAQGDVIVYARKNDTKSGLVVINRSNSDVTIDANVAGYIPNGTSFTDGLYGTATAVVANGVVHMTIPAETGYLMTSDSDLVDVPQVQNIQATGGNGSVALTWDDVAGAESYNIYRSAMEGGTLEMIGTVTVTVTDFTDTVVVNGTKYYYAVTAKMGTGESAITEMVDATPSFPVQSVEITQPAQPMTVGYGSKTSEIQVTIQIPGLTDDAALAGKAATNLVAKLAYYKTGTEKQYAEETKLRYKADTSDGKKIYYAVFEPTEAGTYYYFAKVSTDNSESFTESAQAYLDAYADSNDTTPAEAPALASILQESNRVALNWTVSDTTDIMGYDVYRADATSNYRKIATLDKTAVGYIDYAVSNDTSYKYKVASFDQAYNRAVSIEQQVTPKVVMIDVTMRLHIPDYTPTGEDIYMAGDLNGWNASGYKLTVPSGATNRSVVEYKFKMMANKQIQYKYTRGSWSTEAFTSHTRVENDTTDYGNWAYSSTDTNMRLTIANEGNNQMVVDDYVLRWVDMPMNITMPRISTGSDIAYTTTEDHFTLKGFVPYGVNFTINGQPLPNGAMDAYGNVYLEGIPLQHGENRFELHIEPTAETLAQPWYTDKGRASQATKTLNMVITREYTDQQAVDADKAALELGYANGNTRTSVTSSIALPVQGANGSTITWISNKTNIIANNGTVSRPTFDTTVQLTATITKGEATADKVFEVTVLGVGIISPSNPPSNPVTPPAEDEHVVIIGEDKLKSDEGKVLLEVGREKNQVIIPANAAALGEVETLIVKKDGIQVQIPQEVLKALRGLIPSSELNDSRISLELSEVSQNQLTQLLSGSQSNGTAVKSAGSIYDLSLSVIDKSGKVTKLTKFDKPIVLTFDIDKDADSNRLAVYYIADDGKLEYIGGKLVDGKLTASVSHFSIYGVLEFHKRFSDVPENFWAEEVISIMAAKKIILGKTETQFDPQGKVTRAEFAAMLVRALGVETDRGEMVFKDVPQNAWFAPYVAAAYQAQWIKGKDATHFAPQAKITREEMAVMLVNALAWKKGSDIKASQSAGFKDQSAIGLWAADSVNAAIEWKLMRGDGKRFRPKDNATRAESAQVIYNLLEVLK